MKIKKSYAIWSFYFLFILSLSFSWYLGYILGSDVFLPIDFYKYNNILLYQWIELRLGFSPIPFFNSIVPFGVMGTILQYIINDTWIVHRVLISLCLFLATYNFYYLLNKLLVNYYSNISESKINTRIINLSSFLGAFLYTFNIYIFLKYFPFNFTYTIAHAIFPLIVRYIFLEEIFYKKTALKISLVSILIVCVFANPPLYVLVMSYTIFLYLVMLLFLVKEKRIHISKLLESTISLIVFIILLNLFWVAPLLLSFESSWYRSPHEYIMHFLFKNAKIVNIIRFLGSWAFDSYAFDSPYFPYYEWYKSGLALTLSFTIVIIVLLGLSHREFYRDKNFKILVLTFLISIFLAKGVNEPFGEIYKEMLLKIPFFYLFRDSWSKFMFLYSFSFCASFSYSISFVLLIVWRKVKPTRKENIAIFFAYIIVLLTILTYSWIIFNPLQDDRGTLPTLKIEIPKYWFELSDYIEKFENHSDGKILALPSSCNYQMHYFWWYDGYYGIDPTLHFVFRPLIFQAPGGYLKVPRSSEFIEIFYNNYLKTDFPLWKPLALMNVKYILHRKDLDWTHLGTRNSPEEPKVVKERLQKEQCIRLTASFGKFDLKKIKTDQYFLEEIVPNYPYLLNESVLDFYEIDNNYTLPHIFPASTPILIEGNISEMYSFIISDCYQIGNNAIFLSNQTNKEQWQFLRGYNNTLLIDLKKPINVTVYNDREKPFSWESLNNSSVEARYYTGWKNVVNIGGLKEDTLSFLTLNACPYEFPSYSPDKWDAYMSTLIYIKTGLTPLEINEILENGTPIKDIIGIWWETGWTGMGKPVKFPVTIPPNQKAIIQINHIIEGNVTLCVLDTMNLTKLGEVKVSPVITFKKINPTKYVVKVENSTEPFFLVFSESYHPQWKVYIEDKPIEFNQIIAKYPHVNVKEAKHDWYKFTPEDITFLLKKPQDERYHFVANGYANAWYIDPKDFDKDGDGEFVVILYFLPQSLFYLGLFISGVTLFVCVGYLFYDWMRERRKLN